MQCISRCNINSPESVRVLDLNKQTKMENEQKLFLGGRKKVPYLFQKHLFSIEILFLAILVYGGKQTKVADRR